MNLKNRNRHHGSKPEPLIYCLRSLQIYFCGTNFWFHFWNCLEKWIHLFSPERLTKFWGLNKRYFQNHETLCSQKVSYSLAFFLKFYSCVTGAKTSVTISRNWLNFIWSISIARHRCFYNKQRLTHSLSFWISRKYLLSFKFLVVLSAVKHLNQWAVIALSVKKELIVGG